MGGGGAIAAEQVARTQQRHSEHDAGKIHSDLTRECDLAAATRGRAEIVTSDIENSFDDLKQTHLPGGPSLLGSAPRPPRQIGGLSQLLGCMLIHCHPL
jgi:hypothetical protein